MVCLEVFECCVIGVSEFEVDFLDERCGLFFVDGSFLAASIVVSR